MHLPFTSPREGEKLLRLLNAGIALCIEGETGSGKRVCQPHVAPAQPLAQR